MQVICCICHLCLLTSICCCIFFFSACNCWLRSSSSSILASISCRISSSSCFLAAKRTLISSASAYSSVSAWSCSWRRFFSSQSYTNKMDRQLRLRLRIAPWCLYYIVLVYRQAALPQVLVWTLGLCWSNWELACTELLFWAVAVNTTVSTKEKGTFIVIASRNGKRMVCVSQRLRAVNHLCVFQFQLLQFTLCFLLSFLSFL